MKKQKREQIIAVYCSAIVVIAMGAFIWITALRSGGWGLTKEATNLVMAWGIGIGTFLVIIIASIAAWQEEITKFFSQIKERY